MIKVTVPATSANLGSGFDSMGVALRLYNEISMEPSDTVDIRALGVYISGAGPTLIAVVRAGNKQFVKKLRGELSDQLSGFRICPLLCDMHGARVTLSKHSGRS